MIKSIAPFTLAAIALAGCATAPSPEFDAKRAEIARTVPTCSSDRECAAKWEAAQLWIVKNAGYKLQLVTPVLLETYNATGSKVELAAQVTKEPLGAGKYSLNIKVWCDNFLGCHPDTLDATLDFQRKVNAVQP